jgi:hypothetical protein
MRRTINPSPALSLLPLTDPAPDNDSHILKRVCSKGNKSQQREDMVEETHFTRRAESIRQNLFASVANRTPSVRSDRNL